MSHPSFKAFVTGIFSLMFFIGLLAALFFCAFSWLAAIGGGGVCSNEIVQEATAPDGRSKAVVYLRNCGATVDYTSHITILDGNHELGKRRGNVWQAGGSSAWDAIDIIWRDNSTLEVYHQIPAERVHVKKERVSDYEVVFSTCENEMISKVVAPNEQHTALVYERYCRENTAYTSHVSIFESGRGYEEHHGNVLQAFGNNDENSIEITWVDSHTLRVAHRISGEKIIRQKEKQLGVDVIYERLRG